MSRTKLVPLPMRRLIPVALWACGVSTAILGPTVQAASHREAPFITNLPKVDGTDFYMFRSYETGRDAYVTFIADYYPLQAQYGGPNFFNMDPNALYEIHVDNNGDAIEDISFQFRFTTTRKGLTLPIGPNGTAIAVPLINIGPVSDPANINVSESYTLDIVRGDRRHGQRAQVTNANTGEKVFQKPLDNIGKKSIPDYASYSSQFIYNVSIPGCSAPGRVFVGQRKEPFYINLGEFFDLVNIQPTSPPGVIGPRNGRPNILDDDNVTSLALEVPIACLTKGSDPVIGAWTTASIRQGRLINPTPKGDKDDEHPASREGGAWVQVSRLGMPLVNEVVIGLKDKDRFNHSKPKDDVQFLNYVTNPTVPPIVNALYGVPVPAMPRNDLVSVFLTGVAGVNKPASVNPSEMLRLNTALPATPAANQNDLGALGCFKNGALQVANNPDCDPAGYPNGRRPVDDITDITLRAAEGALLPNHNAAADLVTDGARLPGPQQGQGATLDFLPGFPYILPALAASPAK